jgi:5,10-methenyltetrahydrofolate synthetase
MHEPMGEAPRRPDSSLKLQDFRLQLKEKQSKASLSRKSWQCWPSFSFEAFLDEHLPKTKAQPIIGYFSTRTDWDEPESLPVCPNNCIAAFPRIKNQHLSFHICTSTHLVFNRNFGVWEAPSHAPECTPDFLFVPCFAADLSGKRLGRGGGYYDRYLSSHPNMAHIGILHSDYVYDELPKNWFHSGDQRIEALLTESSYYFDLKEYTL